VAEQLNMQREDYESAIKEGRIYLCRECDALTISDCDDVNEGECFYCGSRNVSQDKAEANKALQRKIAENSL